jgi:formimidoylglutamate deiminase
MRHYTAEFALIDGAVLPNVAIAVDAAGRIAAVTPGFFAPGAEVIRGMVVPGVSNVHSHAFQRAMAGLAERAGPEGEGFWGWRDIMYRFLAVLTPEDVEAIAAQLYVECLLHGYTSVAEFHYLHNAPDGQPYADPCEMARRIVAAGEKTGIGLTLLPVLYRRAGFGGAPATAGQRRFVLRVDAHARMCETMAAATDIGVAPHSLRAVTPDELFHAVERAAWLKAPLHIHVAEQVAEVEACLAWSGARPVAWLLDHAPVGETWCLIHATHIDPDERRRLAASGAVAGLCQTTEANLGDGSFPLFAYLGEGGAFGIGSDSNVGTSPVEELRWLDYTRRLERRSRNVTRAEPGASIAARLLAGAWAGGARALGRACGTIAPGFLADLVALDTEHPALVGRAGLGWLDAWIFSGNATPVRDVMVRGRFLVRDGIHIEGEKIRHAFAATMRRLLAV